MQDNKSEWFAKKSCVWKKRAGAGEIWQWWAEENIEQWRAEVSFYFSLLDGVMLHSNGLYYVELSWALGILLEGIGNLNKFYGYINKLGF